MTLDSLEPMEDRLTEALQARATSIAVNPDEERVYDLLLANAATPANSMVRRRGRAGFLMACAAGLIALAMAGGAVARWQRNEGTTQIAASASQDGPTATPFLSHPGQESPSFILWIVPGASSEILTGIDQILAEDPDIVEFRYVSLDEVFEEFTEHYADSPDVLELVDPTQVPTYFAVHHITSGDAENTAVELAVRAVAEQTYGSLEGVFKVQFPTDELSD